MARQPADGPARRGAALKAAGLLTALAAFLGLCGVAAADRHPPPAFLVGGDHRQQGALWSYEWSYPSGPGECAGIAADGIPTPPRPPARLGDSPAKVRIVFDEPERPQRVAITAYRKLDDNGTVSFEDGRRQHRLVSPLVRGGQTHGWEARLKVRPDPHLYLAVDAAWRGGRGCRGGDASWVFSVRR